MRFFPIGFSAVFLLSSQWSNACFAQVIQPAVITAYKTTTNGKSRSYVSGIINLDQTFTEPGSGCEQWIGTVKVSGVQFSSSGTTIEQFRFKDKRDNLISVPTNFKNLSNAERGVANSFIREGQTYFAHIQICGSGGFASLVNIYNLNSTVGAFD